MYCLPAEGVFLDYAETSWCADVLKMFYFFNFWEFQLWVSSIFGDLKCCTGDLDFLVILIEWISCSQFACYLVSSGVQIQEKSSTAEADRGAAKSSSSASTWHTRSHTLDFWPCWAAAVIRWCLHWGRCAEQRHTLHPYREIHLYTGTYQRLFTRSVMYQGSHTLENLDISNAVFQSWKIVTWLCY